MKLTNHSSVPVYTISGSSTARPLPEWLARKRKRSLKNDPEFANRIELLQDFEFEEASCCVRASEDGEWVMSTGTYKPQIHTHYLPHLSLSFARHTTALNLKFLLLSSDYSKSLHLQTDRSLEFHTPGGCHYTTRIPRYGRDLRYDKRTTEAIIPSVGVNADGNGEVFRLNLELGQYLRGYEVDVGGDDTTSAGAGSLQGGIATGAVNTAAIAEESHALLAFGTSSGNVEFWDSRSRGRAGVLTLPSDFAGRNEVTALDFHHSGLTLAAGSSTGLIHLYDLRSPVPLLKKDQGYGYPIQNLAFLTPSTSSRGQQTLESEPKILSADKRIIKIWNERDGSPWTSVEPAVDLNDVIWCKDSGMLLTANEGRQQHSFFIPQLGPAPKWCPFLDSVVEELAEDPDDPSAFKKNGGGEIYDNYKFLTIAQLRSLNLDHLVGTTNLLRPYMHGYFVAQKLYEEARVIADPYVWEEERARRIQDKINKERDTRIRGDKKIKVKVNQNLAGKLSARAEKRRINAAGKEIPADGEAVGLLQDSRFSKVFEDEEFAIDEGSREFKLINPSTVANGGTNNDRAGRNRRTAVEEEEDSDRRRRSSDDDDEDDASDDNNIPSRSAPAPSLKKNPEPQLHISSSSYKKSGHRSHLTSSSAGAGANSRSTAFGDRIAKPASSSAFSSSTRDRRVVGEKSVTFAAASSGRKDRHVVDGMGEGATRERRGGDKGRRDKGRRSASGNVMRGL
ncbi:MAG: hypothetical protein M1817_000419 [Caeruleum heppii]|nr:MAG: hypothetical protein M1817_000419 [Caeruleum heppii]